MWTSRNRARYDRSKLRYPSDVTDEEWELMVPLVFGYMASTLELKMRNERFQVAVMNDTEPSARVPRAIFRLAVTSIRSSCQAMRSLRPSARSLMEARISSAATCISCATELVP